MHITINRDGKNHGPYPIEEVRELLANGNLLNDDLAHHEGASDWVLLKDVPNLRAVGISAARRITGRLLLLEPDELVCRMLLTGLQELGHSVLSTNDLLSAQREIEEQPFDLVVLDTDFHDASKLLDRLGQRNCPAPVIVTSSRDRTSQIARVFASGAADYLTKPINLAVMAARVQAMLRLMEGSADIRSRLRRKGFSGMVDLPAIDNQLEQVSSGCGGAATLRAINDILRDVLHAERASVFRCDAERDELLTVVAHGVAGDSEGSPLIRMKADTGLAGAALRLDRTLNIPDAYADNRFNPQFDRETDFRTSSVLCFPLHDENEQVIGVAQVLNHEHGPFMVEAEIIAGRLATRCSSALADAFFQDSDVVNLAATIVAESPIIREDTDAADIDVEDDPAVDPDPSRPSSMVGTALGRYRLQSILGSGTQGVVFQAKDE